MSKYEVDQPLFTSKDQNRLHRLEGWMADSGSTCQIDIMAIGHSWEPGEILTELKEGDVVTLELTRGVVDAGLKGSDSQLLDRNLFWRGLIEGLREVKDGKLIRGVEVNQTARNAWKRLGLNNGTYISSALLTVEVNDPENTDLKTLLSEEDIEALKTYNWITVDDAFVAAKVMHRLNKSYGMMKKGKIRKHGDHVPLSFPPNLSLAANNIRDRDGLNGRFPVTFMKSPDSTLVSATQRLQEMFLDLPIELTANESKTLSLNTMLKFILSHAELKDAEEILTATYQFAYRLQPDNPKSIRTIHAGGADHAPAIQYSLQKHVSNPDAIIVNIKHDPRFPKLLNRGGILEFFGKTIPFENRLKGINVEGYEAYADPDFITNQTKNAVLDNIDDFRKRVLVDKILSDYLKRTGDFDVLKNAIDSYTTQSNLYDMKEEELQRILVQIEASRATQQSFLL